MSSALRIIFAGSGEFGIPTLSALLDAGHTVAQIFSQPDRPAGRGRGLTATPVSRVALDRELPVVRTSNINAEPLSAADALVVIAFGQRIAQHVIAHPRLGGINLHASLLPKYRGAAPINWAIINGEAVTGNSVIRLAERMDAGAVFGQSELRIGETETAGELHDRLAKDGAPLMLRVLEQMAEGSVVEQAQLESEATVAPKLSRQVSVLDWKRSARELASRIRGLSPWPGCRVRLIAQDGGEVARLSLLSCVAGESRADTPGPGFIDQEGHIVVADGVLRVVLVQPEGKRPMTVKDFRNGHPWSAGMRLESIV